MSKLIVGMLVAIASVSHPATAQPIPASNAPPVDPTSLSLARQVLAAEFPPEKREQAFAKMMDSIMAQSRMALEKYAKPGDKGFQSLVEDSTAHLAHALKASIITGLPDIYEARARAYARNLSPDDLQAVLAFAKSPAGQHYYQSLPSLSNDPDVIAATQRAMARLLTNAKEIAEQNQKAAEDYVAAKAKAENGASHKPAA